MASGWGITGNKGRCYDFCMDFSDCISLCREPKDCALFREDYFECLHHPKELNKKCQDFGALDTLAGVAEASTATQISRIYVVKSYAKNFQRRNRVYKEEQRQLRAAAGNAKGGGNDVHL
ncbi:hypothetical protein OROGR_024842 [Orobanche gracilis]